MNMPPVEHFQKFVVTDVTRPELFYYKTAQGLYDKVKADLQALKKEFPKGTVSFPPNALYSWKH